MRSQLGSHRRFWRRGALWALLALLWTMPVPAAPAMTVLTIDAEYLQSTMPLYAAIAAAAEQALQGADAGRRGDVELARDLRQSEVLTALPEAIAEVARAAAADLVIDRALARRLGETDARDITDEVEKILVAQFSQLPLEPGS